MARTFSLLNHSELRYRTLVQLVKALGKGPAGVHAFGMQAAPEKGRVCAAKAPAPINCSAREMTGAFTISNQYRVGSTRCWQRPDAKKNRPRNSTVAPWSHGLGDKEAVAFDVPLAQERPYWRAHNLHITNTTAGRTNEQQKAVLHIIFAGPDNHDGVTGFRRSGAEFGSRC
jgi:hypothetical protein